MAIRKVAQFKECSLKYVAPGGGTFKFSTDLPGGVLVERTGGIALPASPANHDPITHTFPLTDLAGNPLEGSLYKPEVDPPANNFVEVLEGVVYLRAIGVYLDGASNEKWDTMPIAVGV